MLQYPSQLITQFLQAVKNRAAPHSSITPHFIHHVHHMQRIPNATQHLT